MLVVESIDIGYQVQQVLSVIGQVLQRSFKQDIAVLIQCIQHLLVTVELVRNPRKRHLVRKNLFLQFLESRESGHVLSLSKLLVIQINENIQAFDLSTVVQRHAAQHRIIDINILLRQHIVEIHQRKDLVYSGEIKIRFHLAVQVFNIFRIQSVLQERVPNFHVFQKYRKILFNQSMSHGIIFPVTPIYWFPCFMVSEKIRGITGKFTDTRLFFFICSKVQQILLDDFLLEHTCKRRRILQMSGYQSIHILLNLVQYRRCFLSFFKFIVNQHIFLQTIHLADMFHRNDQCPQAVIDIFLVIVIENLFHYCTAVRPMFILVQQSPADQIIECFSDRSEFKFQSF